ncbi:hypothetical protein N9A22_04720 [Methylophilaceae bacterium]|nr:hypothetical protein [Methylophilaceae bacterium]
MNKKFNGQFFWLFAIIGFFLAIFLFVNEYFLNQIATDRFNSEIQMCVELSSECNLKQLANEDPSNLNKNQLKLIELNTIIENYEQYIIKVAQIFFAFIFYWIYSLPNRSGKVISPKEEEKELNLFAFKKDCTF